MRRFLYMGFWLTVFGTLALFLLSTYDKVERLEFGVTGNIQTDHIDRIWFSPGGELVGIGRNETQLIVHVWSGSTGALVRERAVSLSSKSPEEAVFAVSGDASQAAWLDPAGVRVISLTAPEPARTAILQFARRVPISSLAFTGPGKLAALYRDGELEVWDIAGGRVVATMHLDIADPARLISSGSYLAAYSSASGYAFVLDTAGDRFSVIEHKQYPRDVVTLALSPQARFAVAIRDTIEQPGYSVRAPGLARSLAFFDRNHVLAGGDFPGIYLLSPDEGPRQVANAGPGMTALAATGLKFAFGNPGSLTLVSGSMVPGKGFMGMSRTTAWLLLAVFGLLFPVLINYYGSFGLAFRKFLKQPLPEEQIPSKRSEEGPIPTALVQACQNGDCVLWAGSGLGAQAGLPTWSVFLRELVEWAAQIGLAPAHVAGFSEGQGGAVVDRIAAALETREQELHAYLRQRFRVSSELSPAHRLIKEIDFQALVTTSLDNLLDRTFSYSGGRVYTAARCEEVVKSAARRDFFLLKPYGDLDEPDTIRIGPKQCAEVIASAAAVSDLMGTLMENRVFLFIGASLEGLERDLANLNLPAPGSRKHYALVPMAGDGWQAASARLRERYGIEPLTYSPSTARHPEVVEFLTTLNGLVRQRASSEEYIEAAK